MSKEITSRYIKFQACVVYLFCFCFLVLYCFVLLFWILWEVFLWVVLRLLLFFVGFFYICLIPNSRFICLSWGVVKHSFISLFVVVVIIVVVVVIIIIINIIIIIIIIIFSNLPVTWLMAAEKMYNTSRQLDQMLIGYDRRLRPGFGGNTTFLLPTRNSITRIIFIVRFPT